MGLKLNQHENCRKMVGTYQCSYAVYEPRNAKLVNVDKCLMPEIATLWNMGVDTVECCCGHYWDTGYIAVYPEDVETMKQMGYRNDPRVDNECVFLSKTKCGMEEI